LALRATAALPWRAQNGREALAVQLPGSSRRDFKIVSPNAAEEVLGWRKLDVRARRDSLLGVSGISSDRRTTMARMDKERTLAAS